MIWFQHQENIYSRLKLLGLVAEDNFCKPALCISFYFIYIRMRSLPRMQFCQIWWGTKTRVLHSLSHNVYHDDDWRTVLLNDISIISSTTECSVIVAYIFNYLIRNLSLAEFVWNIYDYAHTHTSGFSIILLCNI